MRQKDSAKASASATKKRPDSLEPYREQAAPIIRLFFSDSTPAFVRDLLGSWLNQLENETQIFWNRREVLTVALPLMLREAEAQGLAVFDADGRFYMHALVDAAGCIDSGREVRREPTTRETLNRELERDAEALARLLNSPHFPPTLKHSLASDVLTFMDAMNEQPEVIKTQWPLAVLANMEGGE